MPLYWDSGICVESWVEMKENVPMRYEVNEAAEHATLYFGQHENYVLTLSRENLEQVASLAGQAVADLGSP